MNLTFKAFPNLNLSVCRLKENADFSALLDAIKPETPGAFWSFTLADGERSLICEASQVPIALCEHAEENWRALKIDSVLDFSLVGIIASVSQLFREAGISIFCVSTYDTDWILVKESTFEASVSLLRENGHDVYGC